VHTGTGAVALGVLTAVSVRVALGRHRRAGPGAARDVAGHAGAETGTVAAALVHTAPERAVTVLHTVSPDGLHTPAAAVAEIIARAVLLRVLAPDGGLAEPPVPAALARAVAGQIAAAPVAAVAAEALVTCRAAFVAEDEEAPPRPVARAAGRALAPLALTVREDNALSFAAHEVAREAGLRTLRGAADTVGAEAAQTLRAVRASRRVRPRTVARAVADSAARALSVGVRAPLHRCAHALLAAEVAGLAQAVTGGLAAAAVDTSCAEAVRAVATDLTDRPPAGACAVAERRPRALAGGIALGRHRDTSPLGAAHVAGLAEPGARRLAAEPVHAAAAEALLVRAATVTVGRHAVSGAAAHRVAGALSRGVLAPRHVRAGAGDEITGLAEGAAALVAAEPVDTIPAQALDAVTAGLSGRPHASSGAVADLRGLALLVRIGAWRHVGAASLAPGEVAGGTESVAALVAAHPVAAEIAETVGRGAAGLAERPHAGARAAAGGVSGALLRWVLAPGHRETTAAPGGEVAGLAHPGAGRLAAQTVGAVPAQTLRGLDAGDAPLLRAAASSVT